MGFDQGVPWTSPETCEVETAHPHILNPSLRKLPPRFSSAPFRSQDQSSQCATSGINGLKAVRMVGFIRNLKGKPVVDVWNYSTNISMKLVGNQSVEVWVAWKFNMILEKCVQPNSQHQTKNKSCLQLYLFEWCRMMSFTSLGHTTALLCISSEQFPLIVKPVIFPNK